jgi:hypothetical protein
MKPIIKKRTHYSVMLMRDDREVRSFRIRGGILRFLALFFLLLIVAGGAGIGAGIHYWKQISALLPLYQESERLLADTRVELTELRSFKAVTMAQNNGTQPPAQNNEVGAAVAESTLFATSNAAAGNAASNSSSLAAATANATATPERNSPDAAVETAASFPPPRASALPKISDENSPIHISEFSAQALNNQYLRIRYTLSVPERGQDGRPVSGLTRYAALLADGSRVELSPNSPGSSRFSISYMKPISTNVRLPQGHLTPEVQGVDVFIETADGTLYSQSYAFPSEAP